jgi:hypothetical protein
MCGTGLRVGATSCHNCGESFGGAEAGIWRTGRNVLVMQRNAHLPDRCIHTNNPAEGNRLQRNLSWHHPAWYITILACGLLPYIIIALVTRKTAIIHIGLSTERLARRRRAIMTAWGVTLFGLALVGIGIAYSEDRSTIMLIPAGTIFALIGLVIGVVGARAVSVKKITDDHIWLKDIHPDYLAELPEWEGRAV